MFQGWFIQSNLKWIILLLKDILFPARIGPLYIMLMTQMIKMTLKMAGQDIIICRFTRLPIINLGLDIRSPRSLTQ
ncbi:hypothetical protein CIT292_11064 [Citrobacter youngae ATCC 29220]|uniref:Uncharacterized protein n=1 Tax=Citrobacter youngae ATCC 29220 TaxID=500640 RepID=D4BKI7_9ENTR|nr:hypothetical protein CIT292_11064 [Citrobacter youngae ATCC 29220]